LYLHLFDFPHLMKCIRNMLLNKDLHFDKAKKKLRRDPVRYGFISEIRIAVFIVSL
jgi:hypothetical protein